MRGTFHEMTFSLNYASIGRGKKKRNPTKSNASTTVASHNRCVLPGAPRVNGFSRARHFARPPSFPVPWYSDRGGDLESLLEFAVAGDTIAFRAERVSSLRSRKNV